MLSMGPGRRPDDTLLQVTDDTDAEPVDLGVRSRPSEDRDGAPDPGDGGRDAEATAENHGVLDGEHWLAGLVRADVLGVSGAALLLLLAIGMPFLSGFDSVRIYLSPAETSPAWMFAPTFVAAGVAAALGLGGLRQAAYHGAAAWVRITAGVAGTVGLLVTIGTAIVWFAMTQSDPFEQLRP